MGADKELAGLERRLEKEYRQARKEMRAKYNKFTRDFAAKDKEQRALLQKGIIQPDEYKAWREGKMLRSAWFKDMTERLAKDQNKVNQRAAALINGSTAGAYAEGFNFGTYSVEKALKMDTGFTLYNKRTVERLAKDNPRLLPKAKVNIPKDVAWNQRKMNSAITQGILQGESVDKVADRLMRVTDMNASAAMRNARTMVGSAESEARLDSFMRAAEMGIKQKKTWIATLDDRVRDSHAELDGETVPLEEPFSNGLMYPRDPSGEPAEVYNCRCEIITQIEGFERDVTDLNLRPAEISSYDEWKREHTGKGTDFAVSIAAIVAAKGVTEESVKECGKIFADEIDKTYLAPMRNELDAAENAFKGSKEYKELERIKGEIVNINTGVVQFDTLKERYDKLDELTDARRAIEHTPAYKEARKRYHEAKNAMGDFNYEQHAQALADKLRRVRDVGAGNLNVKEHLYNSRSPMRKHIEFAYDHYPTAWIKSSVDYGKMGVRKVSRGYYAGTEIAISGSSVTSCVSTSFHELGHRFEDTVAGLRDSEKVFYQRRTAGEPLQWLGKGYKREEKSRFDKFINAYMGKDYSGTYYELVSMGFQYAYTDPFMLAKDPDMQQWIYGLLAIR